MRNILKRCSFLVFGLFLLLAGSVAGCTLPTSTSAPATQPAVGFVPQGWHVTDEDPYGTYEEDDGTFWGKVTYEDPESLYFVQMYYGDVPPLLKGRQDDGATLISYATQVMRELLELFPYGSSSSGPTETGTMSLAGQLAGWAKAKWDDGTAYDHHIVFVKGSTCVYIYACYDSTPEAEAAAMSLVRSIDL